MAADKQIKFQFALDENSFNRVKNAMDVLIRQAQTLANALKSVQLPGGGGSGGPSTMLSGGTVGPKPQAQTQLGKVVLDNAGAFQNMAALGGTALRGLTTALKSAVSEQEKDLQRLNRAMNALGGAYQKLSAQGKDTAGIQARMVAVAGKMTTAQGNLAQFGQMQAQANMAATNPMAALLQNVPTLPGGPAPVPQGAAQVAAAAAGGGGAGGGLGLLSPIGPGGISPQNIAAALMGNSAAAVAMRSAGYLVAGAKAVTATSMGVNNLELDTRADRGNAIRARYERVRRGNIEDSLAEKFMGGLSREDQASYLRSAFSGEAEWGQALSAGLGSVLSGNVSGKEFTAVARETMGMERYNALMEKVKQDARFVTGAQRGYDYLQETEGERRVTAGILGRGFYQKKGPGGKPYWDDSFTDLDIKQRMVGGSAAQLAGTIASLRNAGVSTEYAGMVGGAERAGFSGVTEALDRLGRAGADPGMALRAALGGGVNKAAGMMLANATGGFDAAGIVNPLALMGVFQGGFGLTGQGALDKNQVERFGLGMASLSNPLDGYGTGMRTVSAIQALSGGSTYAQDALARMGTKQLLAAAMGSPDEYFSNITGLTGGDAQRTARKMLSGQYGSVFSRYVDQGEKTPASEAIRRLRAATSSGQDMFDYMGSLSDKDAKALAAAYTSLGGEGGYEAAVGAINIGRGVGTPKLAAGKVPFGSIDDATKAKVAAEAEQQKESAKQAKDSMDAIVASFKELKSVGDTITAFGKMSTVLDVVTDKLAALGGVSAEIVKKGKESVISEAGSTGVRAILKALAPNAEKQLQDPSMRAPAPPPPRRGGRP